jgi:hypothetical protein
MDGELAKIVLGNDLDDDQVAWCVEPLVPEMPRLLTAPLSLVALRGIPTTWVPTMLDLIVAPDKHLEFASKSLGCEVVGIDVGHRCTVSRPAQVAELLNDIAR